MKTRFILTFLALFVMHSLFAQGIYRQNDLNAGNFRLQNGKVHFEKAFNYPASMPALEKRLKSFNDPSSGMQVKDIYDTGMKGVMIRYQLDWTSSGFKNRKIPKFLRFPINANFEVIKDNNSYRVRVTDIWFTNMASPGTNQHLTLESMTLKKQGMAFTKKKKTMRALNILDENLENMFMLNPSGF